MTEKIERRVRRIIAGQVRSYTNDHPEMFQKSRKDWRSVVANGIAKRATPDVLTVLLRCGEAGAVAPSPAAPDQVPDAVEVSTAASGRVWWPAIFRRLTRP
jgi:hypothetical protein